jgi:hypothetical protein
VYKALKQTCRFGECHLKPADCRRDGIEDVNSPMSIERRDRMGAAGVFVTTGMDRFLAGGKRHGYQDKTYQQR